MRTSARIVVGAVIVVSAGAAGTLLMAAAVGMPGGDLVHMLTFLVPAAAVTIVVALLARRVLGRTSLRQRFVAIALIAALVAIANLGVLASQMFVSDHDATVALVTLVYAAAAGVAAAIVVGRASSDAVSTLAVTARALGDGDLTARAGELQAGPELDALGTTLDTMASQLEAATQRERQNEAMRRDLITTVSHDLRTPLASLRAMVEAIDDGVVDDVPSIHRYTREMRRSVRQLSDLVDDLFELTQLDEGAIEAETRRARLSEVVMSALATVELQADEKGLSLVAQVGDVGEELCSPHLARVLQNLLVNAVRHTPADGTVRVEAARVGDHLALAVQDSGEGIAPEDLRRVFEPFFRADAARSGAGAGLGLALAKRIVEALGGRIHAESRPAGGSRFEIEIPRVSAGPLD